MNIHPCAPESQAFSLGPQTWPFSALVTQIHKTKDRFHGCELHSKRNVRLVLARNFASRKAAKPSCQQVAVHGCLPSGPSWANQAASVCLNFIYSLLNFYIFCNVLQCVGKLVLYLGVSLYCAPILRAALYKGRKHIENS